MTALWHVKGDLAEQGAGQFSGIICTSSPTDLPDVTEASTTAAVGHKLAFQPGYGALLAAMASDSIKKCLNTGGRSAAAAGA